MLCRVDLDGVSDTPSKDTLPEPLNFLPSPSDLASLNGELTIIISRILVQHLEDFKAQRKTVPMHIPSRNGNKIRVVPMGVLLCNENKLDEMSIILARYMQFVPTVEAELRLHIPIGGEVTFDDTRFHNILFGGDQLTVDRVRGTQALWDTEYRKVDKLEGVTPVIEDWHARMTLMKALWGRMYETLSSAEKGTMFQLKNLIHRTNVPLDPQSNMSAAEDFMLVLLHAHIGVGELA